MNAKRVTLHSLGEGGYASAGFAKVGEDATAVKPWSFTVFSVMVARQKRSVKVNPPAADKSVKLKTAEEKCFIKTHL